MLAAPQRWAGRWLLALLAASCCDLTSASCDGAADDGSGAAEDACLIQLQPRVAGRVDTPFKASGRLGENYEARAQKAGALGSAHADFGAAPVLADSGGDPPEFMPERVTALCIAAVAAGCSFILLASYASQFVDEHSGAVRPSLATEMLVAAETRVSIAPPICVFLLACSIYTFGATGGEGHIPMWASLMVSAGVVLQLLLALCLPVLGERRAQEGEHYRSPAPTSASLDALELYELPHVCSRRLFWNLQLCAMLSLYVGFARVTVAALAAPAAERHVQAGVAHAAHLSALNILAHLPRWIACGFAALRGREVRSHRAVLAASGALRALRKAPQLALLAVAPRRRRPWAASAAAPSALDSACLLTLPGALLLEATASGFRAAIEGSPLRGQGAADEGEAEMGDFEVRAARALGSICQGVLYVGIAAVCAECVMEEIADPENRVLAPETWIVWALTLEFFAVHAIRWLVVDCAPAPPGAVATEALGHATALAACCPLVGSLFGARHLLGTVPPWAWEAMHASAAAVLAGLLCHLAEAFGAHGQRLLLYGVTAARYAAFFVLFTGVLAVSVSFPVSEPRDAGWSRAGRRGLLPAALLLLSLALAVLRAVGHAVRHAVESLEESLLGVRIRVAVSAVNLCRGTISLGGLVVENPSGHDWASDCLFKFDRLFLDVSLGRLVRSLGRELEIEALEVQGMELNFEKPSGASSNVQVVRDHLGHKSPPPSKTPPPSALHLPGRSPAEARGGGSPAKEPRARGAEASPAGGPEEGKKQKVSIRRLAVKDTGAVVSLSGRRLPVRLADLDIEDFSGQMAGHAGGHELAAQLLRTILDSAALGGKALLEEAHALEERAVEAVEEVAVAAREASRALARKAEGACADGCLKGLQASSPLSRASPRAEGPSASGSG